MTNPAHLPAPHPQEADIPESEREAGTTEPWHRGRPQVRSGADGGVLLLCPYGHIHTYVRPGAWAGSFMQARVGDPNWEITCHGAVPPHLNDVDGPSPHH